MIEFVNAPAVTGAKRTTTFVEPPADSEKVAPERMVYGPPDTAAVPLLTVEPPLLLIVNTACAVAPVMMIPKSCATGLTPIWPGVSPAPVTEFVESPPLLAKMTLALTGPD